MTLEQRVKIRSWFERAQKSSRKLRALKELRVQCQELASGLARSGDRVEKGRSDTVSNRTADALTILADVEKDVECKKIDVVKQISDIWYAISNLEDDDQQTVLIYRYLLFRPVEQVAKIFGWNERTIINHTNDAFKNLSSDFIAFHLDSMISLD